ncbi:MAG: TetR family transcriptional regulator C-terminal domain-containing protein [Actinomycetota bacterium]|nr:TetR family transcriptional regulator C-terminal domain-containing protein [Actinomycetota bacterium]
MSRIPATQRRDALAHAALAVISRDGLAAATTRAIVAEAGMPLASFHYAVASRDELLRDVVELVVAEEGIATVAPMLAQARSIREAATLALTGYLEFVRRDPGHEQAMFELTQYALRTPGLDDLPAEQYARYHALAIELLDAATAQLHPEWRVPMPDLARLLVSFTDGLTLAWLADRDDAAAARSIELAAAAIASFANEKVRA